MGAGAVGGAIAAVLDRAGHDVVVAARPDALQRLQDGGILLDGAFGAHSAQIEAATSLSGDFELVVFATKAPDLAAAVEANAGARFPLALVVRNGLGARDEVERALGDSHPTRVSGGLAVFAASLVDPGHVTITAPAPLYIGGGDAQAVTAILRGALPVVVSDDPIGAEWTKLVVNQVNALPAITGLSVQATIADRRLRRALTRGIRETVAIARRSGVCFARLQGLSDPLLRLVGALPIALAEFLPRAMARRMGATPNPGSTLQSIRRGRPTEVDWLNGAVVRAAEAFSGAAPVNAALVDMVHEVERTGRFFSVDEVVAALPR